MRDGEKQMQAGKAESRATTVRSAQVGGELTVPLAGSATHQHLLAVLATELSRFKTAPVIRVLDAGCGDGELISYLSVGLPIVLPGAQIEFYGFDVTDHGIQPREFLQAAVRLLSSRHSEICWEERIRPIASDEPWPFPDECFHAVISNQVLEHVFDHTLFMAETARVLVRGGFAAHVFPSKTCFWEPHLHLPGAHWITDRARLTAYIAWWSRHGVGKYRSHLRTTGVSVEEYSRQHADYLINFTNYLYESELFAIAHACKLEPSSRYFEQYFIQKCRRVFRRPPLLQYRKPGSPARNLGLGLLPWLASTTLFLEKAHVGEVQARAG
jgi:SAM-dependent methyltransferase